MMQKVRPYLELIGFGELEKVMPAPQFILASILTDALDQAIDNCNEREMDVWWKKYGNPKTYSKFRRGIEVLAIRVKPSTIPQEIIALADLLITILPTVKTQNICKLK